MIAATQHPRTAVVTGAAMTQKNVRFSPGALRLAMAKSGRSAADLARDAGVSRATVSRWLSQSSSPTADSRLALERLFGLNPGDLLEHSPEVQPSREVGASYQVARVMEFYPLLPIAAPIEGRITEETVVVVERLRELETLTKRYLDMVRGQLADTEEAVLDALRQGVEPEPGVFAEVNIRTSPTTPNWAKQARALAKSKAVCEGCGQTTQIVPDPEKWEEQVRREAGSIMVTSLILRRAEDDDE